MSLGRGTMVLSGDYLDFLVSNIKTANSSGATVSAIVLTMGASRLAPKAIRIKFSIKPYSFLLHDTSCLDN